jgi:hypothetical protein
MKCSNCKYWRERFSNHTRQRYTTGEKAGEEFDDVLHQSHTGLHWKNTELISNRVEYLGTGDCDHPKMGSDEPDGATLDPGHDGDISFGKDFGCIHFQPKP